MEHNTCIMIVTNWNTRNSTNCIKKPRWTKKRFIISTGDQYFWWSIIEKTWTTGLIQYYIYSTSMHFSECNAMKTELFDLCFTSWCSFLTGQCCGLGWVLFITADTSEWFLILQNMFQVVGFGARRDHGLVYHTSDHTENCNDE